MQVILDQLLAPWQIKGPNQVIKGIRLDSRTIQPGDCFVALPGNQADGRHYIDSAIRNGAVAILFEVSAADKTSVKQDKQGIWHIGVPQLHQRVSALASRFYGYPSEQMSVIGVTGTNGKSTVTHLLASWYAFAQHRQDSAAVIGTLGSGLPHALIKNKNTTPDAVTIQRQLASFKQQNKLCVALEVSSHGVVQYRVHGVTFKTGIFTNLSRDHLDYHGSMAAYAQAKWRFLEMVPQAQRVINADDDRGFTWLTRKSKTSLAYSLQGPLSGHAGPQVIGEHLRLFSDHLQLDVVSDWGKTRLEVPLIGHFNAENLLAAVSGLLLEGLSLHDLAACAHQLTPVPGRMEVIKQGDSPVVVVDYAHTPQALEQVLKTLQRYNQGRLWCLIGCGGERDQGKRALMGKIAEQYADFVIFTDDNPRHEDPEKIIEMMLQDVTKSGHIQVIHHRKHAIEYMIERAQANDTLLLAGKGHECTQLIGDTVLPHSDMEIAQRCIRGFYD